MNESQTQLAFGGLSPMRIDRLVDRFVTYERVVAAISRRRVKVADHPREMILHDASGRRRQLDDLGVEPVIIGRGDHPVRTCWKDDAEAETWRTGVVAGVREAA